MINTVNMLKWIEALENDGLKQCTGRLTRVDGNNENPSHCCLGVATEVALANGLEGLDVRHGQDLRSGMETVFVREYVWINDVGREVVEKSFLPGPVIRWLGLEDQDVTLASKEGIHFSASVLNDKYEYTFADIAAALRLKYGL